MEEQLALPYLIKLNFLIFYSCLREEAAFIFILIEFINVDRSLLKL